MQSVLAIALLMVLALGVVEVALVLYGRNVVMASAHEGARAALELGRNPNEAVTVARRTIEQSTGELLDDVEVDVAVQRFETRSVVVVEVSGRLRAPGPLPIVRNITARATATREMPVR